MTRGRRDEIITLPLTFLNTNHCTFFHLLVGRLLRSHSYFIYLFSIETMMHFPMLSHDFCHAHCSPPFSLNTVVISSTQVFFFCFLSSKVFSPTGPQLTRCCVMFCMTNPGKAAMSEIHELVNLAPTFIPIRPDDLNS